MKSSKGDSKSCGVCGDKALGYNFNAITCESCKAFFRRNALIQKSFKCPFSNQCEVTTITRRFCQKCRLDKCFAIGMCKDLIMSEQDKVAKRQKIEENRVRKQSMSKFKSSFKKVKREADFVEPDSQLNSDLDNSSSPAEAETNDKYHQVSSSDDVATFALKNVLNSSDVIDRMEKDNNFNCVLQSNPANTSGLNRSSLSCTTDSRSSSNDNNLDNSNSNSLIDNISNVMNDVQSVHSYDRSPIESILCEAIKLEFQAFSSISQIQSNSRELNDAERAKLNELIVANKAFLTPVDEEYEHLVGMSGFENAQQKVDGTPALVDVINLTTIYVRRLIKMAKKIGAFRNMCQEDQVALLKGGCTEIMLLRSTMNYDSKKQIWQIPHSVENLRLNVDILKLAKGNIYMDHDKFIKTFCPLWKDDENIILILGMVLLFCPDRPKIVHQDVIKLEQNAYYYLLRRYLESIHPGCEAKSTFLKLMQKLSELRKLNEELISVYLNINPSHVEPLLIEIFDLNNTKV
ncbi:unnamed protein product [Phyllotreta striolata]|uniref:Nuclear hormone receptor HR96 n=1 Tax=Phyllotreta striolata TaxID=444603 RepID=A0A9N9XS32_PHYSR|nr:unnamed protein product [Phyllotreta striolata]